MLLPFTTRAAQQNTIEINAQTTHLTFSLHGALLIGWEACFPDCSTAVRQKRVRFEPEQESLAQLQLQIKENQELTRRINSLPYRLKRTADEKFIYLDFVSGEVVKGVALRKFYRISNASYEIEFTISVLGPQAAEFLNNHTLGVKLFTGKGLKPSQLAGFSSGLEKVAVVKVNSEAAITLENIEAEKSNITTAAMEPGDWYGIRNRFWTLLLQSEDGQMEVEADYTNEGSPQLTLYGSLTTEQPLSLKIYAGPVELQQLSSTATELDNLFFSHLWSWMRIISFGLLYILTGLYALIGDYGLAIIALAFAVKILMLPLTAVADKWQHEVNEIHTKLQPHLKEIKANYRGEEQVERIHALYKEHDTNMFFTLKSLFGFLIQIPVFIAVYNMLGENFALDGEPFLWIKNLAQPDHFLKLPFTTPFFGNYLNALPFIMTLVTLLASMLFDAHTLSADLQKKQQRQLYMMALLFFVLFYTFPAGMVLYWTSTNLIQLFKDQILKYFRSRKKPQTIKPTMTPLTEEQITHFKKHGFLLVRNLVGAETAKQLPQWIDEITQMPLLSGKQMVYLEDNAVEKGDKTISRIEKFLDVHEGLNKLAHSSALKGAVAQIFSEAAVVFKEKINFQPPFGGGILPHQDIQAGWLDYVDDFISIAVTVDETTVENGCTEIDVNWHSEGLVGSLWEPLDETMMKNIKFEKFPTKPGDVVFFDGFVPHQALSNKTAQQRRIMFLTYNPASQGEHSKQYYADKRKNFPPDNEREEGKEYVFRV